MIQHPFAGGVNCVSRRPVLSDGFGRHGRYDKFSISLADQRDDLVNTYC